MQRLQTPPVSGAGKGVGVVDQIELERGALSLWQVVGVFIYSLCDYVGFSVPNLPVTEWYEAVGCMPCSVGSC